MKDRTAFLACSAGGGIPRHFTSLAFVLLLLPALAAAQPRFQLRRTTQQSSPFMVRLFAGYNGVTEPSDALQDMIENTWNTSWGGLMLGLQGGVVVDTIGIPVLVGGEVYYHRMAKRYLGVVPGTFYTSDSSRVSLDEYIGGYGAQLLLILEPFPRTHIMFGAGLLYLNGSVETESEITGLFPDIWMGTVSASLAYALLKYDQGSIDAMFRLTKGFGTYGSLQFQSLLNFTFLF